MRKIYYFLIAIFSLGGGELLAQQEAQFTQYTFNPLYYNPAYAGVEGLTKITAVHRTQWANYGYGNPISQVVSFTTPIYRLSSGFGTHFVQDRAGPVSTLQLQGSYAYHLHLKELRTKLSFGARFGAVAKSIDEGRFEPNDIDDPLLKLGQAYEIQPDFGAGVYVQSSKIFGGVSFSHLVKSEFQYANDLATNPLENHMYVLFGYDYEYGRKVIITPSLLVQSDFNTYNFTLSAIGNIDDKYWAGLSFRQGESINIITGYSVLKDKSLRFGYSFDYVVKGRDAKSGAGSHEALITYTMPQAKPNRKKIIRDPRFRHE
ncbi:type IX secretion system membrane protein PorP/SprF [Cesiribacter sp. SM1]|uniref:PorP/SprF family type IX secretion system membrane protein n=1 Tax=Cesiribacter sp. SM1 TaxID=2861196 RepID=UPI001CD69D92|nr:type IX secretion system membrane protein PorP/SprF [Cesiribacter sp. SM1]